jgi:hypothetical protein
MCKSRGCCGIYKGGGKGWEACLWLSMLSTDRHFHGLLLCCFRSFLLAFQRATKAVGFCSSLQDVGAVSDPIQQRFAEPRVRNHLRPFGERKIRSQHNGSSFSTFGNHLKEKLSTDFGERHIPNFIDSDQIVATPAGHHTPEL